MIPVLFRQRLQLLKSAMLEFFLFRWLARKVATTFASTAQRHRRVLMLPAQICDEKKLD